MCGDRLTAILNEIYSRGENKDLRNPTKGPWWKDIKKKDGYQILILEQDKLRV